MTINLMTIIENLSDKLPYLMCFCFICSVSWLRHCDRTVQSVTRSDFHSFILETQDTNHDTTETQEEEAGDKEIHYYMYYSTSPGTGDTILLEYSSRSSWSGDKRYTSTCTIVLVRGQEIQYWNTLPGLVDLEMRDTLIFWRQNKIRARKIGRNRLRIYRKIGV